MTYDKSKEQEIERSYSRLMATRKIMTCSTFGG